MQYLLLFLEGLITFISPCLLPMLPVYVSYFAAGQPDKRRALVNALGFVLGFTAVFVALGAFAGTLGGWLNKYTTMVNILTGIVVILLGLHFMGVIHFVLSKRKSSKPSTSSRSSKSGNSKLSNLKPRKIKFINTASRNLSMQASIPVNNLRFFSAVLFGFVFSIGWTPCVSVFLGSALMMASQQGHMTTGVLMLLVYSLGLGIPFVISALLLDSLKNAFGFIKRHYRVINVASGLLLVVVGILMMLGYWGRWLSLLAF